jgi:Holliday junction DNA helicase RuvA
MYEYISGKLTVKTATYIVVEAGGIGYNINISLNTFSRIKDLDHCKIYTHLAIKEDAHTLYGFADETEKKLFRHLISVSGVGAGTARMILSSLSPPELQQCIVTGNAPVLQNIKGIGAKSAQRIIIDLKDKLGKETAGDILPVTRSNTTREEALSALVTLGFARNIAEKSVDQILRTTTVDISVEALIKSALNNL